MHGGLPVIGFSTIVYGVVGIATLVVRGVRRLWRRR
jgi:hypothetical protein